MKVSRRSWHYRFVNLMFDDDKPYRPTNLCKHFWAVIGTALGLGVFGALAAAFFVLASPAFGLGWLKKRIEAKRGPKLPKPPREPGLLRSYLRAKKQRVCPLIELED